MTTETTFLGLDDPRREADRTLAFAIGASTTWVHAALTVADPILTPITRGAIGGFAAVFIWRWLME
jgi:hypothetical protein